jgi:glycosyltransferase involved in cell wall biosynthesis
MPAHNEGEYLEAAVSRVVKGLRCRGRSFELIVCENGSTDTTTAVAQSLSRAHPEVRVLTFPNADYGQALQAGFLSAGGDVVANFDVDYVDLDFLDAALKLVENAGGPAIVVASKRGAGARDTRSVGRRLVTAVFSVILRFVFGLAVSDTHGMKVLYRPPLTRLVASCRFGHDLFDTEMVLRAERAGLTVAELPVTVRDTRPSRTPILKRIPRSLGGLARLRLALWHERRQDSR